MKHSVSGGRELAVGKGWVFSRVGTCHFRRSELVASVGLALGWDIQKSEKLARGCKE